MGGDHGDTGKRGLIVGLPRLRPGGALRAGEGIIAVRTRRCWCISHGIVQAQGRLRRFIDTPGDLAGKELRRLPPGRGMAPVARENRPRYPRARHAEPFAHLGRPRRERAGLGVDNVAHLDAVIPYWAQLIALGPARPCRTGFCVEGA